MQRREDRNRLELMWFQDSTKAPGRSIRSGAFAFQECQDYFSSATFITDLSPFDSSRAK